MSDRWVGQAYQVETTTGEVWSVDVTIGVTRDFGLVSASSRGEFSRGEFLPVERPVAIRKVFYERDRGAGGRYWVHDLDAAFFDPDTGAIEAPTAVICRMRGDYICEG